MESKRESTRELDWPYLEGNVQKKMDRNKSVNAIWEIAKTYATVLSLIGTLNVQSVHLKALTRKIFFERENTLYLMGRTRIHSQSVHTKLVTKRNKNVRIFLAHVPSDVLANGAHFQNVRATATAVL